MLYLLTNLVDIVDYSIYKIISIFLLSFYQILYFLFTPFIPLQVLAFSLRAPRLRSEGGAGRAGGWAGYH